MTAQLSFSVGFFTYLPFLILASVGFVAFSGMTQNVPTRIAPGMSANPTIHGNLVIHTFVCPQIKRYQRF